MKWTAIVRLNSAGQFDLSWSASSIYSDRVRPFCLNLYRTLKNPSRAILLEGFILNRERNWSSRRSQSFRILVLRLWYQAQAFSFKCIRNMIPIASGPLISSPYIRISIVDLTLSINLIGSSGPPSSYWSRP